MGKQAHREAVEDHLSELGYGRLDPEDEALLRHIFDDDDRPPQGLHRQGYKPPGYCFTHGVNFYGGKCDICKMKEEDEAVDDYLYPEPMHEEFFYEA